MCSFISSTSTFSPMMETMFYVYFSLLKGQIIWVFEEMTEQWVVLEVWDVKRNSKSIVPCGVPSADHLLWHTHTHTHTEPTQPFSLTNCGLFVVNNPGGCGGIHLYFLELLTYHCWLLCVRSTGEIKGQFSQCCLLIQVAQICFQYQKKRQDVFHIYGTFSWLRLRLKKCCIIPRSCWGSNFGLPLIH